MMMAFDWRLIGPNFSAISSRGRFFKLAKLTLLSLLLFAVYQFCPKLREPHGKAAPLVAHRLLPNVSLKNEHQQYSNQVNTHSSQSDVVTEYLSQNEIRMIFTSEIKGSIRYGSRPRNAIIVAIVSCGLNRVDQALVALKSSVILSKTHLHFVIMTDDELKKGLSERMLIEWPEAVLKRISYEIHPVNFPETEGSQDWKSLFKLCASQRLFLPSILKDIDSLIYVDTDVLFLTPPEELWGFFRKMNATQMAALAPEHEDYSAGWYNRFARHPFVKPLGVNSGVMLMNLTRMRSFRWEERLEPILKQYKYDINWGDQDIINIIFHFHSDKLLIFPCEWNYRSDHCIYSQVCKSAAKRGVKMLHGSRDAFINQRMPTFKAIYEAIKRYPMGTDMRTNLWVPLKTRVELTDESNCGRVHEMLTKSLEAAIIGPKPES